MTNLNHLFTFPIIMIDGASEDKKEHNSEILGLPLNDDIELIEGEACIPYYDFISVSDRWLPTEQSLQDAVEGKFDACGVLFAHSGTFIVPWSKEKFKKELTKFLSKQPKESSSMRMGTIQIGTDLKSALIGDPSKGLLDG